MSEQSSRINVLGGALEACHAMAREVIPLELPQGYAVAASH